jgi:hypothetical protein
MLALAAITVPVGVTIQGRLAASGPEIVRQVFGATVLAILGFQALARVRPRECLHHAWMLLAFPMSGAMAGLAGMGGPPAVVWVMAHRWPSARSRATLWALFAGLTPIQLVVLARRFGGAEVGAAAIEGVLLVPFALIGLAPGLWIGARLSPVALRRLSVLILAAVSIYAIVQPWITRPG